MCWTPSLQQVFNETVNLFDVIIRCVLHHSDRFVNTSLTFTLHVVAHVLLNFVIITTAVLFRLVLRRPINNIQWASLICLLAGMVSLSPAPSAQLNAVETHNMLLGYIFVLLQWLDDEQSSMFSPVMFIIFSLSGSFGNIYSEKVMKDHFATSIHVQNTWIYSYGVLFNGLTLLLYGNLDRIMHYGFFHGYNPFTVAIIAVNTVLGLTVSLILKHTDNMVHIFLHQITTVVVLVLSMALFDFRPTLVFLCGATVVGCAIYIFNVAKYASLSAPQTV